MSASNAATTEHLLSPEQSKKLLLLLCNEAKEGRLPEPAALATALAGGSGGGPPADAEGLQLRCKLLKEMAAHHPSQTSLWLKVMFDIITRIFSLDEELQPAQFAAIQKALKLFYTLLHGKSTSCWLAG